MMKRALRTLIVAAAAAAALAGPAQAGQSKVVVELLTSQGCSSCPPADAFLVELAKRDDVIALSFHVDYWNYIGWQDPFSFKGATRRQHAYRAGMGLRYVYTPQMVIGGALEHVGSGRAAVLNKIDALRAAPRIDVTAKHAGDHALSVSFGAGRAGAADVWLVSYDGLHTTEIRRGENEGVTLKNAHVVRSMRRIGSWSGKAETMTVTLKDGEMAGRTGCAVIVQKPGGGQIIGAASLSFGRGES
jgi:hypothetical protein